ncbi:MAG: hypothetical protein ACOCYZ_00245 [Halococcoides sp.]
MASNTDELRDLFMEVSDEATLTERQTDAGGNRVGDDSLDVHAMDSRDALADAVAGAEAEGDAVSP